MVSEEIHVFENVIYTYIRIRHIHSTVDTCLRLNHGVGVSNDGALVKPEDHWSCIAHLIAEDMLKSAAIEEKKKILNVSDLDQGQ